VGAYRFSRLAEADLLSIGIYTLFGAWGEAQTLRYLDELEQCRRDLGNHLTSGRPCDHVRPGLFRREVGKHVVFFRREPTGILVSRILHERMLTERHAFSGED
jgi:toxin ParE1/3/4